MGASTRQSAKGDLASRPEGPLAGHLLPRSAVTAVAVSLLAIACVSSPVGLDTSSPLSGTEPPPTSQYSSSPATPPTTATRSQDRWQVTPVVVCEDGAWSWFQDERAIFIGGRVVVSSLSHDGDVQVSSHDLDSRQRQHSVLHSGLERDDHDVASLLLRPDGRVTGFYNRHAERTMYYRTTTNTGGDLSSWGPEQTFDSPGIVAYSNPFQLSEEMTDTGAARTWLFFRHSSSPAFVASDDDGATWSAPADLIRSIEGTATAPDRPYVKYVSNGRDTIHILYTSGHPNEFTINSIYHLYYKHGKLHRSDGTVVATMTPGVATSLAPEAGTIVHNAATDEGGKSWTWDATLDWRGRPVLVYSTFPDSATTQGALANHEYRYARWTGTTWEHEFVAHGGSGLYTPERYYSGGITVDPDSTTIVYLSSNVDPVTGEPTSSGRYEIFRGHLHNRIPALHRLGTGVVDGDIGIADRDEADDDGRGDQQRWTFEAITQDSTIDNLRPIVPANHPGQTAVLWMQGTYTTYQDYTTRIVGLFAHHNIGANEINSTDVVRVGWSAGFTAQLWFGGRVTPDDGLRSIYLFVSCWPPLRCGCRRGRRGSRWVWEASELTVARAMEGVS